MSPSRSCVVKLYHTDKYYIKKLFDYDIIIKENKHFFVCLKEVLCSSFSKVGMVLSENGWLALLPPGFLMKNNWRHLWKHCSLLWWNHFMSPFSCLDFWLNNSRVILDRSWNICLHRAYSPRCLLCIHRQPSHWIWGYFLRCDLEEELSF